MSSPSAIDRYLNNLQQLGDLAERQFLRREWQAQRHLPALALEHADRLFAEAEAAAGEVCESPVSQLYAWACSVVAGGTADAPPPRFDAVPRLSWRNLQSWGGDDASPLEKAVDRDPFLATCARFAESKELRFDAEAQFLPVPFFRNRRVYLMARTEGGAGRRLVLLALTTDKDRPELDAVLASEKEITPVFEFSRALLIPRWSDPLGFLPWLEELLPQKPRWQILLNIGFSVLGHAFLLADLQRHLRGDAQRFVQPPGTPGMVMIVFHLPSFPIVFKVIKDHPDPPKDVSHAEVLRKYLVAEHDRVGRLADSHLFRELRLPVEVFDPRILALLRDRASSSHRIHGNQILFQEVLVERRMLPLDLLLEDPGVAWEPLLEEFADAIEDLAWANVFPGDLLPKNFGVTPFGRVVFYDYDDVDLLTSCQFRWLPDDPDAELLSLGPNDVFPEEWPRFLFRHRKHRDYLCNHRPAIFDPAFWKRCRETYQRGNFVDLFPYRSQRRPSAVAEPVDAESRSSGDVA